MLNLRSTSIQSFMRCREEFRQHYLMRRVSAYAEIHRELGSAVHKATEMFWHEAAFTDALSVASSVFANVTNVHPSDQKRYSELKDIIPDMVACYWDNVEYTPQLMIEKEWSLVTPWNPGIVLSGRIDRVSAPWASAVDGPIMGDPSKGAGPTSNSQSAAGPIILTDLKTCSEIEGFDAFGKKVGWERSYHDANAKSFQLGLYDWALRQMGLTPTEIQLECLMKPYARYGKKAGLKYIPMPEVIAYRERFDMILEWITQEIYQYVNKYSEVSPWPMTESACSSKYGNCYLMAQCGYGTSRQTEKLYRIESDLGVYEIRREDEPALR